MLAVKAPRCDHGQRCRTQCGPLPCYLGHDDDFLPPERALDGDVRSGAWDQVGLVWFGYRRALTNSLAFDERGFVEPPEYFSSTAATTRAAFRG